MEKMIKQQYISAKQFKALMVENENTLATFFPNNPLAFASVMDVVRERFQIVRKGLDGEMGQEDGISALHANTERIKTFFRKIPEQFVWFMKVMIDRDHIVAMGMLSARQGLPSRPSL